MNLRKACVLAGLAVAAACAFVAWGQRAMAAWPNEVLPAEDVRNTKHNFFLNQDILYGTDQTTEICVFCHTPHGGRPSDNSTAVPLWNRSLPDDTQNYTMYTSPNFDGQPSQLPTAGTAKPQGVSLACLSCHDGTIGIDALINAPGSGGFLAANKTGNQSDAVSMQFLPDAAGTRGVDAPSAAGGGGGSMNDSLRESCQPGGVIPCFNSPLGPQTDPQFFAGYNVATSTWGMAPFPNLTTNLSDDHPISMQIPDGTHGTAVDPQFVEITRNSYNGQKTRAGEGITYLTRTREVNLDVRDQLRAYPTGGTDSQYIECASCHNPHTPRPLFLRLPNVWVDGSGNLVPGGETTGLTARPLDAGGGTAAWPDAAGTYVSNNPNFQSAICISCHQK